MPFVAVRRRIYFVSEEGGRSGLALGWPRTFATSQARTLPASATGFPWVSQAKASSARTAPAANRYGVTAARNPSEGFDFFTTWSSFFVVSTLLDEVSELPSKIAFASSVMVR